MVVMLALGGCNMPLLGGRPAAPPPSPPPPAQKPVDKALIDWGNDLSYVLTAAAFADTAAKGCLIGERDRGERIKRYAMGLAAYCANREPRRTDWSKLDIEASYASYLRAQNAELERLGTREYCRSVRETMSRPQTEDQIFISRLLRSMDAKTRNRQSSYSAEDCPKKE
jgi:hypothetical protein